MLVLVTSRWHFVLDFGLERKVNNNRVVAGWSKYKEAYAFFFFFFLFSFSFLKDKKAYALPCDCIFVCNNEIICF